MPTSRHRPKKSKRPVQRDNKQNAKKGFLDTKLGKAVILSGFIAFFIAIWTSEDILFYPFLNMVYVAIPFFIIGVWYSWREFKIFLLVKFTWGTFLTILFMLAMPTGFAALCAGAFAIPFNLYIKETSNNNPIESYHCNIDDVSIFNGKNSSYTAYYNFKNKTKGHNISREKAEALEKNETYKKYYVYLEVRKGPFETYVIQNKELRLKPNL